jgi:hypothetical protein
VKFVLGLLGGLKGKLIIGALVLALGWWGVHKGVAMFRSVNTASFTTSAVSLTLDSGTGGERYSALDMSHLAPGADLYVGLSVDNSGSSGMRYGMVTTPSGDGVLAKDLRIGVAAVSGGCDAGAYAAGTRLYGEGQGLAGAVFTGRPLSPGAADHLCFHLKLPVTLPQSLQLESADATFDFTAQQG